MASRDGRMGQLRAEVDSIAEPEIVFGVLTDWPRHREWMPFTRAEGGHEVGAALEGWTGLGPIGFLDTMVITEWEAGRRVTVRHTGRLIKGAAWFATEPAAPGGTHIVWAEDLIPPFGALGRLGWPALRPAMTGFMTLGLRRLAVLAENQARTPRAR